MDLKQKYGSTAMVAGASEGLGAAYSTHLAAAGLNLILIARRKEPLDRLADELRNKYKSDITCIYCDLAIPQATEQIKQQLGTRQIDIVVYNAAIPYIGKFETDSIEHQNQMAHTNMVTPMNMLQVFGAPMLQRGKGAFIIMASIAGFQGSGFLSVYAATKAFDRTLAEGLWYEWKERGVDVIACCAGAIATPNYINTKPKENSLAPKAQEPEAVVKECFAHLGKVPSFVAGSGNRLATFFMQKLLPRKMAITIMGDTTRKMYRL